MTRELCRKPFPGVGSTRTHCGISVSRSVVNGSTATQGVAASAWSGSLPQAGPPWCPRALVQSAPRRAGDGAALAPFVPRHAGAQAVPENAASARIPLVSGLGLRLGRDLRAGDPELGLYDGRPAIWNNHLHPTQTAGPQPGVVARSSFTRRQGPIHAAGDARAPAFKPDGEPHPLPPSPNRGHHVPARANQKCKRRLHDRMDIPVRPGRVALHRHGFPTIGAIGIDRILAATSPSCAARSIVKFRPKSLLQPGPPGGPI